MSSETPQAEQTWRRGDWMQTFTGKRFYPLSPRPEDIDPVDIAHALSLLCRFGGHVDRFYSVAEHCVLMSEAVPQEWALWALLHDATEAYVVDVPRPLKRQLGEYMAIEASVMMAIAIRFALPFAGPGEMPPAVRDADNRILLTERNALMSATHERWAQDDLEPLPVKIHAWHPFAAEAQYARRLDFLLASGAR